MESIDSFGYVRKVLAADPQGLGRAITHLDSRTRPANADASTIGQLLIEQPDKLKQVAARDIDALRALLSALQAGQCLALVASAGKVEGAAELISSLVNDRASNNALARQGAVRLQQVLTVFWRYLALERMFAPGRVQLIKEALNAA